MNRSLKSDVMSTKMVRNFMPSCMIYALVQSMTFLVDTILAGHFLGKDAVAACAMGLPGIGMMLAVTSMVLQGGYLKLIQCLGKSDVDSYNRIFSITLSLTIIIDLIFLALCLFGTNIVVIIGGGAKATAEAAALGNLYVRTASLMVIFFAVGSVFQLVSATFGYQTDRMFSSITNITVNVVVSIVAILFLADNYKIAGLGIGSAAGAFAQMVLAFVMMKRRRISVKFRIYALNKRNIIDGLDCLRRGVPASIDTVLDSACSSVINNIILSVFADGTAVLALFAMIKTINTIAKPVGRGGLYASEPLIGILHGERDNAGICRTFKTTIKWGVIFGAGVAALLIALQYPILSFYKLAGNVDAHIGLTLVAISTMVLVVPFAFNSVYESTNHLMLSLVVSVIPDSILYPIFVAVLTRVIGVTGIWIAISFSFIPFFIVYYTIFAIINKKPIVPLQRLLALKKYANLDTALEISIPIESESVSFVSVKLQKYFNEHNSSTKIAYISALCMEEIAADYIAYRKKNGDINDKSYMDIKAFKDDDKIEIILRNYDEPYDPLLVEINEREDEYSKIGIVMAQKIASDIRYSYAYHLNVVSVTIPLAG
ncbi:MATE family efflux transporter [Eubacterium xylanophilum]|uniref:MATE family efflux transporter n=1 Tax=Eubacterium xylanophilum TaxID=39497 RepID=UPI00047CE7BC|nr:MATE family efflux transporter [Eubacterium xylanophilum]